MFVRLPVDLAAQYVFVRLPVDLVVQRVCETGSWFGGPVCHGLH